LDKEALEEWTDVQCLKCNYLCKIIQWWWLWCKWWWVEWEVEVLTWLKWCNKWNFKVKTEEAIIKWEDKADNIKEETWINKEDNTILNKQEDKVKDFNNNTKSKWDSQEFKICNNNKEDLKFNIKCNSKCKVKKWCKICREIKCNNSNKIYNKCKWTIWRNNNNKVDNQCHNKVWDKCKDKWKDKKIKLYNMPDKRFPPLSQELVTLKRWS